MSKEVFEFESQSRSDRSTLVASLGVMAAEGMVALGVIGHEAAQGDTKSAVVAIVCGAATMIATGVGINYIHNRDS